MPPGQGTPEGFLCGGGSSPRAFSSYELFFLFRFALEEKGLGEMDFKIGVSGLL